MAFSAISRGAMSLSKSVGKKLITSPIKESVYGQANSASSTFSCVATELPCSTLLIIVCLCIIVVLLGLIWWDLRKKKKTDPDDSFPISANNAGLLGEFIV
jgi:hypothetical protein